VTVISCKSGHFVKLVTVISCKSGYFVKLDLIIQEALAAVEPRMRGGNADRSAGFCSLYRLAGFAGFLGRLLQEILKMRFEEEAETLGNLRMAQAASLLGYVSGISPLEHYGMRHAGRSAVHFLRPTPQ
jgi:hypothetical protein